MTIKIKKGRVLEAYDGNASRMCDDLGIDRSNATKWDPNESIPEKHVLKLIFILKRDFFEKERKQVLKDRGIIDDGMPTKRKTLACRKS